MRIDERILFALISLSIFNLDISHVSAATVVSAQTGSFNSGSTWEGGSVPGTNDSVVILSTHTVTLTASDTISSLCVYNADDATTAQLTINALQTLTVNNYVRVQSDDPSINPICRIDLKGTLIIGKDLIFKTDIDGLASDAEVRMTTAGGTLQISGTIVLQDGGGFLNASSSAATTFKMTGSSSKTLPLNSNIEFYNLTIDKSSGATVTLGAALNSSDFFGDFTLNSGKFDNGGFSISGLSTKDFIVKNGTTFIISGSTTLPSTIEKVFESGSTIEYQGTTTIGDPESDYQNLVISGTGTKTINNSVDIIVNGNLTISGGTLDVNTNNRSITVKGNWVNSGGSFNARNGTVTLSGSSNQAVTTNGESFYNLTINNTATQITLNDNLTVSNTLTLTDGVVTTGSYRVTLSSNSSSALAGYSSASFINGNLRRNVTSNTDTYAFPLGNGTGASNYFRADIINGNLTGVTYIDGKFKALTNHNDNDMNVSDEWSSGWLTYTTLNTEGVWELTPNASPSGGNYDIKLYTGNMSGLSDNSFGPLKRPTGSSTAADWSTGGGTLNNNDGDGRLASHGYAIRNDLTSFSDFGVGRGSQGGHGLPIELLSFKADVAGKTVELNWITATETNNDFFTLERSQDAIIFETLDVIRAAGNSSDSNHYHAVDREPFPGISYYRLKQTDYDGSFSYSHTVSVNIIPREFITVFPNPVAGRSLEVYFNNELAGTDMKHISITDLNGKMIFSQSFSNTQSYFAIELPEYPGNGLYMLSVQSGTAAFRKKVIFK
ncbi:MAG TPA: T9SS type A sorting domain-containing protein [Chitinophagales bacterium]|nr:T9SS type A sorting domain-containing protein [Chitinophagales bacterium]